MDSRENEEGEVVKRRRICETCDWRFSTLERVEENFPLLVKKDGSRQEFDRHKLKSGIMRACEKRPVSAEAIDASVAKIEASLIEEGGKEVSSRFVGELVMDALRRLDQVAYVRFASVYREFSDVDEFRSILRSLKSRRGE